MWWANGAFKNNLSPFFVNFNAILRHNEHGPRAKTMNGEMSREEVLRQKLELLRVEHGDLDVAIKAIEVSRIPDRLAIVRLKKRKLALKDQISLIEDELTPDIIA